MFATALESIIGIFIIGVLINSAWKNYSDRIEREQSKKIKETLKASNKNNLLSYYSYFCSVVNEYKYVNFEITTPLSDRGEAGDEFNYSFKFSSLKNLLGPSLRMKHGFDRSIIEIYFNEEKATVNELKYILANFGLEDFPELKNMIIEFLNITHVTSFEEVLVGYSKYPKNHGTRKMLEEMIQKFDELPPKEYHQSNMLTPVIVLYQTIPIKLKLIENIDSEFRKLQSET
jgi:hypothetical protein